jgi:hypothetical protein
MDWLETQGDGAATVLPCRELENLFLDAELIHAALALICAQLDLKVLAPSEVEAKLSEVLNETTDRRLYPNEPSPGDVLVDVVKGSRVLAEVWWRFTMSEYDKDTHGVLLAQIALARKPAALDPLHAVVSELGDA